MKRVIIVGGGASGVLAAVNLLRSNLDVEIVERTGLVGRGPAYGTEDPSHTLNVRAANMSALPDEPNDFVEWLLAQGEPEDGLAASFRPRLQYRAYLQDLLSKSAASSQGKLTITHEDAISVQFSPDSVTLGTTSGKEIRGDALILALGNAAPSWPGALRHHAGHPRFINNPWLPGILDQINLHDRVFLLGTGLTMFDVIATLGERDHKGQIIARSRHGVMPRSHAKVTPRQIEIDPSKRLLPQISKAIREAGDEWRDVVDGLRPHTVRLWQTLSWPQRSSFLRHLNVTWNVLRHRAPERAHQLVEALQAAGTLDVAAGSVASVNPSENNVQLGIRHGSHTEEVEADWVINCTGANRSLVNLKVPLLESAVQQGLAEYDPLGQGLMVDNEGRTSANHPVWAIGPLCLGCRFETVAVPDIRNQAKSVATSIADTFLTASGG